MREKGFLDRKGLTARDLVARRKSARLVTVERAETVARATQLMHENDYSQIPVSAEGRLVGSLNEAHLYAEIVRNPDVSRGPVEAIMRSPFPFADISTSVEELSSMLTPENPAVLVRDFKSDAIYIITRSDVIRALT
jgi:cystathionine beta-synthase